MAFKIGDRSSDMRIGPNKPCYNTDDELSDIEASRAPKATTITFKAGNKAFGIKAFLAPDTATAMAIAPSLQSQLLTPKLPKNRTRLSRSRRSQTLRKQLRLMGLSGITIITQFWYRKK